MKRKCQVYALPTEKASSLIKHLYKENHFEYVPNQKSVIGQTQYFSCHHLYFTTDEKIKEGDWALNTYNNQSIFKVLKVTEHGYDGQKPNDEHCIYGLGKTLVKIVATTNSELWGNHVPGHITADFTGIAHIPEDFVQAFVRENGNIQEVYLEYEDNSADIYSHADPYYTWPKLRSNGTVRISPVVKQTYTLESVKEIAFKAYCEGHGISYQVFPTGTYTSEFEEIFNEIMENK